MNTQRKGQSLVEFALVALVLYLLLGAIFTFGHALYVAQQVQMSADLLAREASRRPMPVDAGSLSEGLEALNSTDPSFRAEIYDADYLRVALNDNPNNLPIVKPVGLTLREWIDRDWPIVNQQLAMVMSIDAEAEEFRIPGMVNRGTADDPRYQIALFMDADLSNEDDWVDVVEEIDFEPAEYMPGDPTTHGPFSLQHPSQGVVAVRINYPVHSAFFTAMEPLPANAQFGDPNANFIEVPNPTAEFDVTTPTQLDAREELYGGDKGLGRQYAWGTQVRPYRRIVSGQAIYRREVFTP